MRPTLADLIAGLYYRSRLFFMVLDVDQRGRRSRSAALMKPPVANGLISPGLVDGSPRIF